MNIIKFYTTTLLTFFFVSSFASQVKWFDGIHPVSCTFMTPMESVVRVSGALFEQDIADVTGKKAVVTQSSSTTRIAGTAGESCAPILLYQLNNATEKQKNTLRSIGIDVDFLSTKTDAFQIRVANKGILSGKQSAEWSIVAVGSNARGTAYALLELSRIAGVSPWVWWGDVVPEKKNGLFISSKTNIRHKASVELRGIFLNDEDWSLRPWAKSKEGAIGRKTYRRIFELLLRLRANAIWPAMHPGTTAFFKTPGAKAEADSCGIFIGTSHCEPLLRNNVDEWNVKERGEYNYITNKNAVQEYWTERLNEVSSSKNNIFTIGMRGIHDGSMEGVKTMEEKFDALQQVIDDQQQLISKHIGKPSQQPQVFVPYKEVLELYEKGLQVPEYVTLLWCDDNYGYITRLSNAEEQKRIGGAGIYYHLSYWGRPHDYLWLTTTQPGLIFSEMKAAYDHNARKLWIANVHDPKVAAYDLSLFLDMAWNIDCVSNSTVGVHLKQWLSEQYGETVAEDIYPAMRKFYQLTSQRKPEFMGWTQVELDKKKYERGLSPVTETDFSISEFNNERQRYLNDYEEIRRSVEKAGSLVRPELSDSYFAHIIYPVSSAAYMAQKILNKDNEAHKKITDLTEHYNNLADGKWHGIMSQNPRDLPVFRELKDTTLQQLASTTSLDTLSLGDVILSSQCKNLENRPSTDLLGHSLSAIPLQKGDTLSYPFHSNRDAEAVLYIALIPTQPNDNGDIRFAVSIDDGEETAFSLKEKYRSEQWKLNVLRGQAVRKLPVHLTKGEHTLRIRAIDNHIIIDQWMMDFNQKRGKFYLFPHTD